MGFDNSCNPGTPGNSPGSPDAALGKQKSVGLATLKGIGATEVSYEDLAAAIRAASKE